MKPVGIYDDFSSWAATSMRLPATRGAHQRFWVDYPLYLIFEYPVAETARKIDTLRQQEQQQIEQPGIWFSRDADPLFFVLPLLGLSIGNSLRLCPMCRLSGDLLPVDLERLR